MKLTRTQKTHVPDEKQTKQTWYLVDVKGKTLGPAAVKIANLLRGKNKPWFTPQQDCGDFVVVVNAKHVRLAGGKLESKTYHWHTGYPAGLRTRTAREVLAKKPEKVLYDAVWGMLPRTKTRNNLMKKLKIFPQDSHSHSAQSPKPIQI